MKTKIFSIFLTLALLFAAMPTPVVQAQGLNDGNTTPTCWESNTNLLDVLSCWADKAMAILSGSDQPAAPAEPAAEAPAESAIPESVGPGHANITEMVGPFLGNYFVGDEVELGVQTTGCGGPEKVTYFLKVGTHKTATSTADKKITVKTVGYAAGHYDVTATAYCTSEGATKADTMKVAGLFELKVAEPAPAEAPAEAEASVDAEEPAAPVVSGDVTEVTYSPRPDGFGLYSESGALTGVVYIIGEHSDGSVPVPFGGKWLAAFGNGDVNGKSYSASATTINLVANICLTKDGCDVPVNPKKDGHMAVTVTWGDSYEALKANAIEQSTQAPNCGGSGCPDRKEDFAKVENEPLVNVTVIGDVPKEAKVILDGQGHVFELPNPDSVSVSVPEGGETALFCREKCEIDFVTYDPGVYRIKGLLSDLTTPSDKNKTVFVSSSDDVTVIFGYSQWIQVYSGKFNEIVNQLAAANNLEVKTLDLFR